MKILICLTYYRPHYSGLTIYAEREARALVQLGHQVTIITSRYDKSLPEHEIRDGVEVVRLDVAMRISKGVIMPGMLTAAWRWIKQADLVQLHVPQLDAAYLALVARLLSKPLVLTYHCDLSLPAGVIHFIANQVSHLANHISASLANLIVTNTLDYAENSNFLKRYRVKVRQVYPPIEMESVTAAELSSFIEKYRILPGQRIIGMAARLAAEKGVEYLAEAIPLVLEKHPTARVLFVGPYLNVVGEKLYAQKLEPLISALGEHWSFLGIISDPEMAAFFNLCEVTVLPSINSTESYGTVQVESMLCGTPVIATDMPGVRIPVQETGSGLIVSPANPTELAQAIIMILDNPSSFEGQPEKLIQNSSPEQVAREYEELFRELLAKSNR